MPYPVKRTPLAVAMLLALNTPLYSPQALALPGDKIESEFLVNTYTTNIQTGSKVAIDADGDFVITWQSYNQANVISSYDIYAQRYNADGSTAGTEFPVNSFTSNIANNVDIAMDADGDFVITWQSRNQVNASSNFDIYAQRYNADGSMAGAEFLVNTFTPNEQGTPNIAMDADGDFVITWQSYNQTAGSATDIYAQRYTADGNKAGTEFLVNTATSGNQSKPDIALDADGDFVIAWKGDNSLNIFAQRYAANGNKAGTQLSVDTTSGKKSNPHSVAMDADGDFIIAWDTYDAGTFNYDVYAQRYTADGNKAGTELAVNTTTEFDQNNPSVAMDANGDFIITWGGHSPIDGIGIHAQRYNADGSTAGSESTINTTTANSQGIPNIAMDTDGDFIITWSGNGVSDVNGTFAQRFEGTGDTIDLSLVVNDDTDPVTVGNNFNYSLITTNNSSDIAMDINLSEPLPTGLTYVSDDSASAGWNCTVATTTLECNLPFMNPGLNSTINVTVTADNAGTISNAVTVSSAQTDSNTADNSDTETTTVTAAVTAAAGGGGGGSLGWLSGILLLPFFLRRKHTAQKPQG